jgi:hypothetical protein
MRLATLLLVVLSVQNASAGESVYDRCIRAAEERDTATVIFSAQLMLSSIGSISPENLTKASECISASVGYPMVFDQNSNSFIPLSDQQLEQAAELRDARNRQLVDDDIRASCKDLYFSNKVSAMTEQPHLSGPN